MTILINGIPSNTIINDMDKHELSHATSIPIEWASWIISEKGMNLPNIRSYTLAEFLSRYCMSCGELLCQHDHAAWRFQVGYAVRCGDCAINLYQQNKNDGLTLEDALYVD